MKLRAVMHMVDRNTNVFEMYGIDKSGQGMKMMEIPICANLKRPRRVARILSKA